VVCLAVGLTSRASAPHGGGRRWALAPRSGDRGWTLTTGFWGRRQWSSMVVSTGSGESGERIGTVRDARGERTRDEVVHNFFEDGLIPDSLTPSLH
jgi:hypothetical protein